MDAMDFHHALRELGFSIEQTGGGCTAWHFYRADGSLVRITQDLHHEIDPNLFFDSETDEEMCPIEVGTYAYDEISETCEAFTDLVGALLYVIRQVRVEK